VCAPRAVSWLLSWDELSAQTGVKPRPWKLSWFESQACLRPWVRRSAPGYRRFGPSVVLNSSLRRLDSGVVAAQPAVGSLIPWARRCRGHDRTCAVVNPAPPPSGSPRRNRSVQCLRAKSYCAILMTAARHHSLGMCSWSLEMQHLWAGFPSPLLFPTRARCLPNGLRLLRGEFWLGLPHVARRWSKRLRHVAGTA
jgi:hypothetical protein